MSKSGVDGGGQMPIVHMVAMGYMGIYGMHGIRQ